MTHLLLGIILSLGLVAHADKEFAETDANILQCANSLVYRSYEEEGQSKTVTVVRADGTGARVYQRTDRGLYDGGGFAALAAVYSTADLAAPALRGLRIVDAGCGDGSFVQFLKRAGAIPLGIDVYLNPMQKTMPRLFREADMADTGEPSASVDLIFSSFSVFYYESENFTLLHQILREFARVLKPNGRILLGGNPARRLNNDMHNAAKIEYLWKGWMGTNDYLRRLIPADSSLVAVNVGKNREVVELRKKP